MSATFDLNDLKRRMQASIASLKHEFGGLRTGRAAASLVEPVHVEAYGQSMPLNQVATISIPEPRMIQIQVWDKAMVIAVDKESRVAIRHIRRDGLDILKKQLKDKAISEDDEKRHETEVQKATDSAIGEVDQALATKEKEIMQV